MVVELLVPTATVTVYPGVLLTPESVAVIAQVPAATAVTSPLPGVTVHTLVLLLTQALAFVTFEVVELLNVPVAVSWEVLPIKIEFVPVMPMLVKVGAEMVTVNAGALEIAESVAVIPHVPAETPVTKPPLGDTVHIPVLLLTQVLALVTLLVLLSLNVPVAVN